MDYKFYLVLEKRLFCQFDNRTYEYVEGKWIDADGKEVKDRLMGYDPSEPSDSPYVIGNADIMAEIKKVTQEQVIEKYGQEVIDKLKDMKKTDYNL